MSANPDDSNPLLTDRVAAERALVGCAFIAQAETRQTCGWLKPEAFWLETCKRYWTRFMAGEDAFAVALDMNLVADAARWGNDVPSAMYAADYARHVAQGAFMAETYRLAAELAQASIRGEYDRVNELQARLTAMQPQAHQGARNWFDVACGFVEVLESDLRSIPTGITSLDRAIAGLERQTESIIAARPSQGKSTLGLQIALHAAALQHRVLFVSLEMSETNLFARAACPLVGVTWLDVRRGLVPPEQLENLKDQAARMGSEYAPWLFVYDRRASTETVWELAQTHQADLVFVDHLRKLSDGPDMPEVKRLGYLTNRMKQMAKELNLHACVLVQLNRGADADAYAAPEMKHLRDSGEIEEDADVIMMLHSKPVTELEKARPTRDTDLWIRKARDGVRDAKVELRFHLRQQKFAGRRDED